MSNRSRSEDDQGAAAQAAVTDHRWGESTPLHRAVRLRGAHFRRKVALLSALVSQRHKHERG